MLPDGADDVDGANLAQISDLYCVSVLLSLSILVMARTGSP